MVRSRPASAADPLAPPGACVPPLCGRNVAILCEDAQRPDVLALQRAAADLGARVALVPARPEDGTRAHTGRVLGRLYDALVCVDLPAAMVRELGEAAGVPVVPGSQADRGELLRALLAATGH